MTIHRITNVLPSKPDPRDWSHALALPKLTAALPDKVDLRRPDWRVGDQGATGSCVGWGVGDGVARFVLAQRRLSLLAAPLSPRFVWMASKETDPDHYQPTAFIEEAGTYVKAAVKVLTKYGIVPDSLLPFHGAGTYGGDQNAFYARAAQLKCKSYFYLSPGGHSAFEQWLYEHGPFAIGITVDKKWDQVGSDGWIRGSVDRASIRGGHCVAVVGYMKQTDGTTAFIVRNSWGAGWGDKGFSYCDAQYASENFTECYGVLA